MLKLTNRTGIKVNSPTLRGYLGNVAAPPPSGPTVLILDQFTAANGTVINGRSPSPTNVPATTWTAAASVTIQSNRADIANFASPYLVATCGAGVSDCIITGDIITAGAVSGFLALCARYQDANNYWLGVLSIDPTGAISIYQIVAGAVNVRATTAATITNSNAYSVTFSVNGTSLVASVVDDTAATKTASFTSAAFQSETEVGMAAFYTGAGYNWKQIDNFKVTEQ